MMRVRVHDKERGRYFKSEVYAIINSGWYEKYVVLVPSEEGNYLKLFDFLDKENKNQNGHHDVLVNIITPDVTDSWVCKQNAFLLKITKLLKGKDIKFDYYRGYDWLLDNQSVIVDLLEGNLVKTDDLNIPLMDSKFDGWNYIDTQDDADKLLSSAHGFHDSVLKTAEYISGASVDDNKSMYPIDNLRFLKLLIDSQWNDSIELVFEGLTIFNLRPSDDNYDSIIYSATIIVRDETVFFIDTDVDNETFDSEYTCAKAYSLRWRFSPRVVNV